MKYTVQALKFREPLSDLIPQINVCTVLNEHIHGWSAMVDEEARIVKLVIKKPTPEGPRFFRYRIPLQAIHWYRVTLASKHQGLNDDDE